MSKAADVSKDLKIKTLFVSQLEFQQIIDNVSCVIKRLDYFSFQLGERVIIRIRRHELNGQDSPQILRYITAIKPIIPLLLDDNIMEYTLSAFNEASL